MEVVVEPSYQVIIRHAPPHQYDHAKQGTICKVIDKNGCYDIYKQISSDEAHPNWMRV